MHLGTRAQSTFLNHMRVLIAGEHRMVNEGLQLLIESKFGLDVVGHDIVIGDVWRQTLKFLPDIVLLDATIEEQCGISNVLRAIERVKASCPVVQVLVLSPYKDEDHLRLVFAAGASGFILKTSSSQRLRNALRVVKFGDSYVDPSIIPSIVGKMASGFRHPAGGSSEVSGLSPRQLEVLILIAWGHTTREIAVKLGVSQTSINTYKNQAFRKRGLLSKAQSTAYGLNHGWFD
ncbi:MAG: response regulator transcription factor [Proteobacteria bacterium]|nr:MAG: response regulator transcription factor [Pseudomonadota bacterium]